MARFLSPQWLDDLRAASTGDVDGNALVVQQVVSTPDGDVIWALRVTPDAVAVELGPPRAADITLTVDVATAAAVSRGELTVADAFALGAVRVAGDLRRLLASTDALAKVGDVFAAVRATTTY